MLLIAVALPAPGATAELISEKSQSQDSPSSSKISSWSLRLPQETNVIYQGVVADLPGGGTTSMLYPAPNIGGFLAAIITHGVLLESTRSVQLEKSRKAANEVLVPYQSILDGYQYRELMQHGLDKATAGSSRKLVEFSEKPGAEWFIESMPVFSITQDQTAIILDNAVVIYAPNLPAAPAYQNVVRVVSMPDKSVDPRVFWVSNAGENLKSESARLLAESLDLAIFEVNGEPVKRGNPHRTVRYMQGSKENMERGEIVSESCDRVVLRNLRGWLMSVPANPAHRPAACVGKSQ